MNLENMKCFISLAECLNFTKAADKEHITQTSMSRKISSLEEELNVRLFYRDNHSVVLTDAGREFYIQAQRLLEAYNASIETVQNIHQGFTRSLKIGVGIYESELLSPFLGTYVSDHPDLRITCLQYSYRELLKRFEQNLLDVIITSDQFLAGIQKEYFNAAMIYEHDWRLAICRESPWPPWKGSHHLTWKTKSLSPCTMAAFPRFLITISPFSVSAILSMSTHMTRK